MPLVTVHTCKQGLFGTIDNTDVVRCPEVLGFYQIRLKQVCFACLKLSSQWACDAALNAGS